MNDTIVGHANGDFTVLPAGLVTEARASNSEAIKLFAQDLLEAQSY